MSRASTNDERSEIPEPDTVAIPRDELLGLVAATARTELARGSAQMARVHAHTVPRDHLPPRDHMAELDLDGPTVSPLAVLAVIAVFIALFIAVTRIS